MGQNPSPVDVLDTISDKGVKLITVDAFDIARDAGEMKAADVVMVGPCPLSCPWVLMSMRTLSISGSRKRFCEVNLKAFSAGRKITA